MSVTITFHTVAEKVPTHGQEIIHLRKTSSFGFDGFEPQQITVEYQLTILDDGEDSGSAVCWDPAFTHKYGDVFTLPCDDGSGDEITYRVDILLDCYHAQPDDLWIDQEEYWACFDK